MDRVVEAPQMDLPRLHIRADAGGFIGTGHVMRMMALAQAYQRRGCRIADGEESRATVVFICALLPETLEQRLRVEGFEVVRVDAEPGSPEDARATLEVIQETGDRGQETGDRIQEAGDGQQLQGAGCEERDPPSAIQHSSSARAKELAAPNPWLVLDGYHFSYDYQKLLKQSELSILCTDDHGYSDKWCCDAILNQNLDAEKHINYENDIAGFKRLLGASFCLFREEFLQGNQAKKPWKKIERLLITLGGSDPENATAATLRLLNTSITRSLTIRVLAGADNAHVEGLRAFESHHQIEIVQNATNMPEQYAWADGIISAGGSTCWEWLYLGLPGAIVTIAENQLPIVKALTESRQAALPLGWFNDSAFEQNAKQLSKWLDAPAEVCDAQVARQLIDGRGADRAVTLFNRQLKVHIITTAKSWLMDDINELQQDLESLGHTVAVVTKPEALREGDVLLILSYWGLLNDDALAKHVHNLVVHESALPEGKGWSPLTWQVLEGKSEIPITLFEAVKKVDAGDIYLQGKIHLEGHELIDEIRSLQAKVTFDLCREFVERYPQIVAMKQAQAGEETFYSRRGPKDSRLDPEQSLANQFNLLRVVDNEFYPAFFEYLGCQYILKIERADGSDTDAN